MSRSKFTQKIGWKFACLWMLLTTTGAFLGGFLGLYMGFGAGSIVGQVFGQQGRLALLTAVLIGFAVAATVTSGIQQRMLKDKLADPSNWVLFSVLAAALTAVAVNLLAIVFNVPLNPGGGSGGTIVGLGVGFAQWLVLRKHGSRAIWWVPANAIAGGLGFSLLNGWAPLITVPYGIITGGALVWILRQHSYN